MNIDDNYGFILSNLINESIEDSQYEQVRRSLITTTDQFTKDSGTYSCGDLYTAKLAASILDEVYDDVEMEEGTTDDNAFIVSYSRDSSGEDDVEYEDEEQLESLNEASIVDKKGGTKLKRNKDMTFRANPAGGIDFFNSHINGGSSSGEGAADGGFSAGGGEGGGMGESWEDTDEPMECPQCGRDMKYVGAMGNYQRYKCSHCMNTYYIDRDDNILDFEDTSYAEDDIEESIEKHDDLNQAIWDGDKLKPEVREKLLQIVDIFKKNLADDDIDLDIKDVYLIGSNAGYNYTKDSDIDCHIMADFSSLSDEVDLVDKLYQARKSLWNDKYDPVINGFDVELYVEPYEGDIND